jgi:predicted signal transduction protein with EAL and GGDEF domain
LPACCTRGVGRHLRSFPFDKIKIDRSFVHDLAERPDCMAIIRAVTGLGASLGIATTAEGVETRAQLDRLRAEGCTEALRLSVQRAMPGGRRHGAHRAGATCGQGGAKTAVIGVTDTPCSAGRRENSAPQICG